MLTVFYTAFSPACFSLLALWLAIIGFNARAWLNSQHRDHRQRQAYIVALYFAAPGTMSLLALIDPLSTFVWRVFFVIVSVLGVAGMLLFGSFPKQPDHLLDVSDHVVHWIAIGLYLAVAALAFSPLQALRVEGVLLTVLVLLGVHVALRLMFAIGAPSPETSESALAVNASSAPRAGPTLSREHTTGQRPCARELRPDSAARSLGGRATARQSRPSAAPRLRLGLAASLRPSWDTGVLACLAGWAIF